MKIVGRRYVSHNNSQLPPYGLEQEPRYLQGHKIGTDMVEPV